jgi:predicted O-methyltransferase YrrM
MGLSKVMDTVGDAVCAAVLAITMPVLRTVARYHFPKSSQLSLKVCDAGSIAVVRKHYYTPIVNASDLKQDLAIERSLPGIDFNADAQLSILSRFKSRDELAAFPMAVQPDGQFYFTNKYYEAGDAEYLYSLIRLLKPNRIIEVGSGFSTLMADAAVRKNRAEDPGYKPKHICIEPYERAWLESVGPDIIRKRVEDCDLALFAELGHNDILFIDSSHVIRPQGDVLFEYQRIIPALNPGVIVHVHDIFTPRDYPKKWVLKDRLLWNEQYLLESFLSFNSDFEIIAMLNWLKNNHFAEMAKVFPVLATQPDCSPGGFWFRRKGKPLVG